MSLVAVYLTTAITFAAASVFFVVWYIFNDAAKYPQRSQMLLSAATVAGITTSVAWVLLPGSGETLGLSTRTDGITVYWLEWAGYTLSLYFIGSSLTKFLFPRADVHREADAAGRTLALVGLTGLLGLFVPITRSWLQIVLIIVSSIVYVHFFVILGKISAVYPGKSRDLFWVILVLFFVATVLYIVGYIFGPPAANLISAEAEHWLYFAGNVLTKGVLPVYEAWVSMDDDANALTTVTAEPLAAPASMGRGRTKFV